MSSIKYGAFTVRNQAFANSFRRQVQDLQSQIAELTQINTHLRIKKSDEEDFGQERTEVKRRHSEAQSETALSGSHRIAAPVIRNFDHVRENIRGHSRGIFSTLYMPSVVRTDTRPAPFEVPQRADFAHLSRSYYDCVHEWYPVLHWPTFQHEVDEIYAARTFEGATREWIGLFFAVLACGTLQGNTAPHGTAQFPSVGATYFELATQALTPWPQTLTIEYAQAAFLLSVFSGEQNWRSIGSMWLSSAVRAAQEMNVHCDLNTGSLVDSEIRRRLWWALYTRDRYVDGKGHNSRI
jgi:hypothetical protein